MNKVIALPEFEKNLKRLAKKYRSLKAELKEFIERPKKEEF